MESELVSFGAKKLLSGDFGSSRWAFDTVAVLDPSCLPKLWQRGICLYFTGRYREGMRQFEADMDANGGDIEEVLWHFICKCSEYGFEAASKDPFLPLRSPNNSPPPMNEVLALYKGHMTSEAVIASVTNNDGSIKSSYNGSNALAYAHYYVGVYHQIRGDYKLAGDHLKWACQFNITDYMGGVMKLHYRVFSRDATGLKAIIPCFNISKESGSGSSHIIYGGWQVSAGHRAGCSSPNITIANMLSAIDHGVLTFDCGDIYTGVEELFGKMIAAHILRGGMREGVAIHTKLVPDLSIIQKGGVTGSYIRGVIHRSLNRLGTDYLDLVQFHWWDLGCRGYIDALRHLNQLKDEGIVKQIGLTNFGCKHTEEILNAGIPIATTQVQFSVLDRRPISSGLINLCQQHGVSVLAYGVLAGGFLTDKWIGLSQPLTGELANRSLVKYQLIIEEFGGWEKYQLLLKTLRSIADRHSPLVTQLPNGRVLELERVTIAMVAIAYVLQQPGVGGVILGSLDTQRSIESVIATKIVLCDGDLRDVESVVKGSLGPGGDVYGLERVSNGRHGSIMKYDLNQLNKGPHLDELCKRYLETIFTAYPDEATRSGYNNHSIDYTMGIEQYHFIPASNHACSDELVHLFALKSVNYDHHLGISSREEVEKYLAKVANLAEEATCIDKSSLSVDQEVDLAIIENQLQLEIVKWSEVKEHEKDPSFYLPFAAINYLLPTWSSSKDLSENGRVSEGRVTSNDSQLVWEELSHPGTVHLPPSFKLLAILSRLRSIPGLLSEGVRNLVKPFKAFVDRAILLCQSFVKFFKTQFEGLVRRISSFDKQTDRQLLDDLVESVLFASKVASHSITKFEVYLKDTLASKATDDVSVGKETYDRLLKHGHMIYDGSDQLLRVGHAHFERVKQEMVRLASKIAPGKTWQEVTEEVIRSKYRPRSNELLAAYMNEIQRAKQHMKQLDLTPSYIPDDERVLGMYTPPCLMPFSPFGDFLNPAPFAGTPGHTSSKAHTGYLMLHPVHTRGLSPEDEEKLMRSHDYSWIKVIAPHECYPGHHIQALLMQSHPRLLRKYHESAYFYEGWGLYCEQLAYETGFFGTDKVTADGCCCSKQENNTSPEQQGVSVDKQTIPVNKLSVPVNQQSVPVDQQSVPVDQQFVPVELTRLTQLRLQLWRAARVILDIRLHSGELTLQQCIQFLCKEVMFDPRSAAGEVMMYASRPTYAPCYIIGLNKILELREKEMNKYLQLQGSSERNKFDLKSFHDKVLQSGSLPFVLIERLMNN